MNKDQEDGSKHFYSVNFDEKYMWTPEKTAPILEGFSFQVCSQFFIATQNSKRLYNNLSRLILLTTPQVIKNL